MKILATSCSSILAICVPRHLPINSPFLRIIFPGVFLMSEYRATCAVSGMSTVRTNKPYHPPPSKHAFFRGQVQRKEHDINKITKIIRVPISKQSTRILPRFCLLLQFPNDKTPSYLPVGAMPMSGVPGLDSHWDTNKGTPRISPISADQPPASTLLSRLCSAP